MAPHSAAKATRAPRVAYSAPTSCEVPLWAWVGRMTVLVELPATPRPGCSDGHKVEECGATTVPTVGGGSSTTSCGRVWDCIRHVPYWGAAVVLHAATSGAEGSSRCNTDGAPRSACSAPSSAEREEVLVWASTSRPHVAHVAVVPAPVEDPHLPRAPVSAPTTLHECSGSSRRPSPGRSRGGDELSGEPDRPLPSGELVDTAGVPIAAPESPSAPLGCTWSSVTVALGRTVERREGKTCDM